MRSHRLTEESPRAETSPPRGERGFGMVEIVVVLAVVSIVLTFAVIGVKRAAAGMRLQNSMRQLASRVEAARLDAIRRHQSATVDFSNPSSTTSTTSYTITMDFNGNGVVTSRSYDLESGVAVNVTSPNELPVFDFDWRGRTPQCFTSVSMQGSGGGGSSTLSVSSAGDVTVDSGLSANLNGGTFTTVGQSDGVQTGAVVAGTSAPACADPCGGCAPAGGGGPINSTPPSGCTAFTVNKSLLSIRKNGKSTDKFTVGVTPADTITVVQTDGRTNLAFTPSPTQAVGAGGSKDFVVTSKNNSTGYFPVKFVSACNASNVAYATVQVTN
jgi:prepilin-type N-terminal cleavage/methylation domain-containing protein